jgi:glycosyltransferase involved in cell wall biosynthesis
MKHRKFIFVSSNPKLLSLELENIEIIKGSWSNEHLSDKRLKDIYTSARMVILPLKNSTQPSGQSVTLQAMSLRVPVLISLTDGFWDTHNFIEDKNIFFERENTLDSWVDRIDNLFIDTKKLDFISKNSSQLIKKNYDIEIFNKFMINEVTQRQ